MSVQRGFHVSPTSEMFAEREIALAIGISSYRGAVILGCDDEAFGRWQTQACLG